MLGFPEYCFSFLFDAININSVLSVLKVILFVSSQILNYADHCLSYSQSLKAKCQSLIY
jgi:hypothetical protein